jgi:D-glycerate 3-kinase
LTAWRQRFLAEQRLPGTYLHTAERFFDPLATWLATRSGRGTPCFVAVNGSQGSGKSTLCAYLREALIAEHRRSCIDLSLDDFYLTRAEREALAADVHPLLRTRGVPGTHDMPLLQDTLQRLARSGGPVAVPRFSKAEDDRLPEAQWTRIEAPVDVVLVEGWCLGVRSVDEKALHTPINSLEREEDRDGRWRRFINDSLRAAYEPVYARFDPWIMLAAPGFDTVLRWRQEQEHKLRQSVAGKGSALMSDADLERFVAHFERCTRRCLADLPARCDVVLSLDSERQIIAATGLGN